MAVIGVTVGTQRDPRLALADVAGGLVSVDAAEREYHVVLAADGHSTDQTATERLRQERKRAAADA